jgi:hypothetical protein
MTLTFRPGQTTRSGGFVADKRSNPSDNNARYERLSAAQHGGLMIRLRHATEQKELRGGTDLDATAKALSAPCC